MKKWIALIGTTVFLTGMAAYAQNPREGETKSDNPGKSDTSNTNEKPAAKPSHQDNGGGKASKPAQIDLGHHTFRNNVGNPEPNRSTRWSAPSNPQGQPQGQPQGSNKTWSPQGQPQRTFRTINPQGQPQNNNPSWNPQQQNQHGTRPNENLNPSGNNNTYRTVPKPNPSRFSSVQPTGSNVAHHHHPYTPGYVRKKLQKVGVSTLPDYIKDRRGILDADKDHSHVHYPEKGPDHQPVSTRPLPSKEFGNSIVTERMHYLYATPKFTSNIAQLTTVETRTNHYYWHTSDGFNYCHYVDNWGYHWYGWYEGDSCFWVRYYGGRWWCYDDDDARWCFWDNDRWWWQDPNHVGDLYLYDYGQYIPADSANDPVVTTVQVGSQNVYQSPDGTRTVKVMTDSGDAFLFDTAIPPGFNPIYLASNVTDVKFSNTSDGSQLEIMLNLSDGSFDLFDDQGNPLNFSDNYQDDQGNQNQY